MKENQIVKVKVDGIWRNGRVLDGTRSDGVLVVINEDYAPQELFVDRSLVKRWERVDENEQAIVALTDLEPALEMLNSALADLIPGEVATCKDGVISAYGGSVTMELCIYEISSIGAFREVVGWNVIGWEHIRATRWEPDDMLDSDLGHYRTYREAVHRMVDVIFKMKAEDYWRSKADNAYAESVLEEEDWM